MITIRKLLSLPPWTRLRKIASLLQSFEIEGTFPDDYDVRFLSDVLGTVAGDGSLPSEVRSDAGLSLNVLRGREDADGFIRSLNSVRYGILRFLGSEPADWDFYSRETLPGSPPVPKTRTVFPFRVFLDDIRSPFNVGSVFRTAEAFGMERVFLSPATPIPTGRRALRASMGSSDIVPYEVKAVSDLEKEEGVFALELGGTPLQNFTFPERGTVIIGNEELGVSPLGLGIADSKAGRVSIPIGGLKGSLNVSVAFGILAFEWYRTGL